VLAVNWAFLDSVLLPLSPPLFFFPFFFRVSGVPSDHQGNPPVPHPTLFTGPFLDLVSPPPSGFRCSSSSYSPPPSAVGRIWRLQILFHPWSFFDHHSVPPTSVFFLLLAAPPLSPPTSSPAFGQTSPPHPQPSFRFSFCRSPRLPPSPVTTPFPFSPGRSSATETF